MSDTKNSRTSTTLTGLAGEYYVLAQLAVRSIVGALTLGTSKGVDILASNPRTGRMFRVEVKTTRTKPRKAKLHGEGDFYHWSRMNEKHERDRDPALVYCFVALQSNDQLPLFFVVRGLVVADYLNAEHQRWKRSRGPDFTKDNEGRTFRASKDNREKWKNDWSIFED